ncbi:hypothetical protein MMC10_004620 [Thelotrema lepadinum]|nr:hypothetical protein [Thelotrema lepadinum]
MALNPMIVTYNCGRELVRPGVFSQHIAQKLESLDRPEIIVLSLQEIAPIPNAFLGGSFLSSYYQRLYATVGLLARIWRTEPYMNVLTRNVGMTAIMVFIKEDVVDRVRWLEEGYVGVGWLEMGNKGAVGARFGYLTENGIMSLTFVSAHLAAMENALERRNEDWKNICQRLVFEPVTHLPGLNKGSLESVDAAGSEPDTSLLRPPSEAGIYTSESHVFVAGDLNYRTSLGKPSPKDYVLFPTSQEDELILFKADQLTAEMRAARTMQGFSEAPVTFAPTYKYSNNQRFKTKILEDSESGGLQSSTFGWAEHRWPSWCDRILYLDMGAWTSAPKESRVKTRLYTSLPLMSTSDHRPVILAASIPLSSVGLRETIAEDGLCIKSPYAIDPFWRQRKTVARQKEIVAGFIAYLAVTWEGNGILLAMLIGAVGGWALIRSILAY